MSFRDEPLTNKDGLNPAVTVDFRFESTSCIEYFGLYNAMAGLVGVYRKIVRGNTAVLGDIVQGNNQTTLSFLLLSLGGILGHNENVNSTVVAFDLGRPARFCELIELLCEETARIVCDFLSEPNPFLEEPSAPKRVLDLPTP